MAEKSDQADWLPDGIVDAHPDSSRKNGWAGTFAPLLLGVIVVLGLSGALGGYDDRIVDQGPDATLSVNGPQRLRNGEFFETLIAVDPVSDVDNLVIALPAGLFRNITINTMIPAAESESFDADAMRFEFGPIAAGERLQFKIDGQVNPRRLGPSSGRILAFDDQQLLASVPVSLEVLP